MYALGCNNNGCFGCGDTESSLRPRKINELDNKKIVDVSAGSGPHVVVLTDGNFLSLFNYILYIKFYTTIKYN